VLLALPTFTSRRVSGAISFTAQVRRDPCIFHPWPSWPPRNLVGKRDGGNLGRPPT
jgi:hypothetical protein